MDNNILEPEEVNSHTQTAQVVDTDMLTDEPVIDRTHSTSSATGPTVQEFSPPPFTGTIDEENDEQPPNPQDHPLANPHLKDASPEVKNKGAHFIADKLIKLWGKGKKTAASLAILIGEKKLDKLEERGLVDRNVPLILPNGQTIPAGTIIEQHNEEAEKIIEENCLTKDFYDEVEPMIVEELVKRDIALTNMQQLVAAFAVDALSFGEVLKPHWERKNEIIDVFKQTTAAYKASSYTHQQPVPPPPPTQPTVDESIIPPVPPPPTQPVYAPSDMVDAIQQNRGGGGDAIIITPQPVHSPKSRKILKTTRKRRKYKPRTVKVKAN